MAVVVILTVLVLNTWTSEVVRLPNYIPTLQANPGGRNDIIESYFRLGLDYTEILFYLVLFHGITLRAILQESEAKLEMKNFNPPSIFVWR